MHLCGGWADGEARVVHLCREENPEKRIDGGCRVPIGAVRGIRPDAPKTTAETGIDLSGDLAP